MKNQLIAMTLSLCALPAAVHGAVLAGDATLAPGIGSSDYLLSLEQSIPPGEGLFAIGITQINPVQFRFDYFGIAEEYALYHATPGLQLLPNYASTTLPFVTNTGVIGPGILTLGVGQSVFLGYWDDRSLWEATPNFDGTPDFGDNYGWLELGRTVAGLVVLDGYTAINSGIIVGTPIAIPESDSWLLCFGAVLLLARRQRPNTTGEQGTDPNRYRLAAGTSR